MNRHAFLRQLPLTLVSCAALVSVGACGGGEQTTATDSDSETETSTTDDPTAGPTTSTPTTTTSVTTTEGESESTSVGETETDPTEATTDDPSDTEATTGPDTDTDPGTETDTDGPLQGVMVGASQLTLLPEVMGSTAYADVLRDNPPLALEPGDPGTDPGVFVEDWDVGQLAIGNGRLTSHWVHDEIRVGAVAFADPEAPESPTLVLVSADVYMLLAQDIQQIRDKVAMLLDDDEAFAKLEIIVGATHNHMGPDTAGLENINHNYFEYLTDQAAAAVVEAVNPDNMVLSHLRLARSNFQYGLADQTAPFIVDPTLHTLQAVAAEDPSQVVATVVQWQNHPEAVLGFGKDVWATDEQADFLWAIEECHSEDEEHCHIEGQYISAGFPGYMTRAIQEQTDGAPALYFNGGVGAMQSPLRAIVWETEGDGGQPAGDGMQLPDNPIEIPKNFHKTAIIGVELAKRALSDLADADVVATAPIAVTHQPFYTRLAQLEFRIGLSVLNDEPLALGHLPRELYTCPAMGPKNDETCVFDNYDSPFDPDFDAPVRVGDHLKTEVVYIQLGPIDMLTIPGEAVTELVHGLPSDFVDDPDEVYYGGGLLGLENSSNHLDSATYTTPGYARQTMVGDHRWMLGLTQDSGGYLLAPADYRVECLAGLDNCAALFGLGIVDYQSFDADNYSLSGERCKQITDDPSLLMGPPYDAVPGAAEAVAQSCFLGTAFGSADDHYEETRSLSWDVSQDWLDAVVAVTGFDGELDPINPDFVGVNLFNP